MRNPNYIMKIEQGSTPTEVIKIDSVPECDIADYDLNDEKELFKYFKDVEKSVRDSIEYRAMTKYLRETLNMNKCSFYKNVNNINSFKIKIHIHHEPFDLGTITRIVYRKRCEMHESIEIEMVAKEIMFLHYNMMVGLIPLAETVHELVHNRFLFIPINKVYGAYQAFAEAYWPFFDDNERKVFNELCEASEAYETDKIRQAENMGVLEKGYTYLDMSGAWDIPELETVLDSMRQRIDEIKKEKEESFSMPKT